MLNRTLWLTFVALAAARLTTLAHGVAIPIGE